MKFKIQPVANLLTESLSKLHAQTSLLEQAYSAYAEILPPRFHGCYQIAHIKSPEIVVTTTSPELRYMLTQFSHDFIRKLQKIQSFPQIRRVTIKIDSQLSNIQQAQKVSLGSHLAKACPPSKEVARLIQQISEGIADPALAQALSNLAKLSK